MPTYTRGGPMLGSMLTPCPVSLKLWMDRPCSLNWGGGHRHPEACHPIPEEQFCPRTCPSPPISSMLVSWLEGSRKFHSILVNEVSGQEGGEANFFHQVAGSSFCRPPDTRRDNYIKYHLRGQCSDCVSGQIPWRMAGSCKGVGVLSMPAST